MSNRSVAVTENKFPPMEIRLEMEHELVAAATSRKRADSLGTTYTYTPSEEKRNRGTDIADSPRSEIHGSINVSQPSVDNQRSSSLPYNERAATQPFSRDEVGGIPSCM